jgi:hypothetical protein
VRAGDRVEGTENGWGDRDGEEVNVVMSGS